jgi:tRNA threonylcarbamoyladenosine biosynthesis protein TsaE
MVRRRSDRVMLTKSALETQQFGRKLALDLTPKDIVAFHGDLGAGKTTLIKGIIQELTGLSEREISSPTFTYLHMYEAEKFPIYHFDLYRLQSVDDFLAIGGLDYLDSSGICLIEWPERIHSLLPLRTRHISLFHSQEEKRRIDVG